MPSKFTAVGPEPIPPTTAAPQPKNTKAKVPMNSASCLVIASTPYRWSQPGPSSATDGRLNSATCGVRSTASVRSSSALAPFASQLPPKSRIACGNARGGLSAARAAPSCMPSLRHAERATMRWRLTRSCGVTLIPRQSMLTPLGVWAAASAPRRPSLEDASLARRLRSASSSKDSVVVLLCVQEHVHRVAEGEATGFLARREDLERLHPGRQSYGSYRGCRVRVGPPQLRLWLSVLS